ncbi:MAG: twin-arginine translocase subunit TatC [Sphingobacteriales bacterium]
MSRIGDKIIGAISNKGKNLEGEMSFFDHLETLRWHLIRSALAIVLIAIIAFAFYHEIWDGIVMAPAHPEFWTYRMMGKLGDFLHSVIPWIGAEGFHVGDIKLSLLNTELAGQFTLQINSSIMIGLTLGIPYVLYELWRFIKPALHEKERKSARGFVFYSSLLFALGVMFGYYVVTPLAVKFLAGYKVSDSIQNLFSIDSYVSTVTTLTLASGVAFQLPILVGILANLGILTPKFMRDKRRYAIVLILILAAFITPTPDALTMLVVAAPLLLLYELSIRVAVVAQKRRNRRNADIMVQ